MKCLLSFVLFPLLLAAQGPPLPPGQGPQFFQVKEFLQLTDAQYLTIFRNNEDLSRSLSENGRRINDLQREIFEQFQQESPDALEIGSRYVEITRVCKVMRDEANGLLAKNQAVLTDAQRTRLRTLEEVARQALVISEAQNFRVLGDIPAPAPAGAPPTLSFVVRVGVGTAGSLGFPGCPVPLPSR